MAVVRYIVDGVPVEVREVVKRREAKLPYGDVLREVRSVPRLRRDRRRRSTAVVPLRARPSASSCRSRWCNNAETGSTGEVTLPARGLDVEPARSAFAFARAGERASYRFTVTPATIDRRRDYR